MSDAGAGIGSAQTSDLLSAVSLLLTVLGILYGTWYPEITQALDADVPDNREDRTPVRRKVCRVLAGKAAPLAVAAIAVTVLFLPDAWAIARFGYSAFDAKGTASLHGYNAVQAAICLVVLLTGLLAAYLVFLACRLVKKLWEICG